MQQVEPKVPLNHGLHPTPGPVLVPPAFPSSGVGAHPSRVTEVMVLGEWLS